MDKVSSEHVLHGNKKKPCPRYGRGDESKQEQLFLICTVPFQEKVRRSYDIGFYEPHFSIFCDFPPQDATQIF